MKILLINPNRYLNPPVPPIGLEYLAGALKTSTHDYTIIDLCFSDNPLSHIEKAVEKHKPDIAGITIRNIDTVLYQNNRFFLDEFKPYVGKLRAHGIPVVAGGSGFSFMPEDILSYIGADWGVNGPGEAALVEILDCAVNNPHPAGTVVDGWKIQHELPDNTHRAYDIEYETYINHGGLAGFETQKGCSANCSYCSEGGRKVLFKKPEDIVHELWELKKRGIQEFHLCDTEFNHNLEHCKAFLTALISDGPDISWTAYMKTSPCDEELIQLMKSGGVSLITLSIPTDSNSIEHAREISHYTAQNDITLAIDYLCGFPGQTMESIEKDFDTLKQLDAATIGVNTYMRLYQGLDVTDTVLSKQEYRNNLLGAPLNENTDLIQPIFYNHVDADALKKIIDGNPRFKIEGFEQTTNYERIRQSTDKV